jgi:hypothetical protein
MPLSVISFDEILACRLSAACILYYLFTFLLSRQLLLALSTRMNAQPRSFRQIRAAGTLQHSFCEEFRLARALRGLPYSSWLPHFLAAQVPAFLAGPAGNVSTSRKLD